MTADQIAIVQALRDATCNNKEVYDALDALLRDARRYRWLRGSWGCLSSAALDKRYPMPNPYGGTAFWRAIDSVYEAGSPGVLDAAIDAAMEKANDT